MDKVKAFFLDIKNSLMEGRIDDVLKGYSDIIIALLVIACIGMMIIPMPTMLLDILLCLNIAVSFTLLLIAIYVPEPLAISSFPTILLITTLFRLGLNVSSTRLILLYANPGEVVKAFGNFVVGGNLVVGFVIFLVLVVVQFMVIGKGSERVAEVAARFTLDAMPGKQMSIDADIRAGSITMEEGRKKRNDLGRESQLFGSMDGAMKFVKGDSIAGMIITVINLVAGMIIGVVQNGMPAGEAMQLYSTLTIGDGLVSMIASLLISVCTGLIVTRVASEVEGSHLGLDIGTQILRRPKAIAIASGLCFSFGLIPGLPMIPFFILGALSGTLSWGLYKSIAVKASEEEAAKSAGPPSDEPASPDLPTKASKEPGGAPQPDVLALYTPITPMAMEVSAEMTPLVDTANQSGQEFVKKLIPQMRDALYEDLGMRFPGIEVRGGASWLPPDTFVIKVYEVPLVTSAIFPGHVLVPAAAEEIDIMGLQPKPTINPADGSPASWVPYELKERAEMAGLLTYSETGYMLLTCSGVFRKYAKEFLGLQEVQIILDNLEQFGPALAKAVVPNLLTLQQFTDILQRLVEEQVSLRDLRGIIGTLAEWALLEKDTTMLVEYCRVHLKRYISFKYSRGSSTLLVYLLDPQIEEMIRNSIQVTETGNYLALEPQITSEILQAIRMEVESIPHSGQFPVIVTQMDIRRFVRLIVALDFPNMGVISFQELVPEMQLQPIATISIQQVGEGYGDYGY
jgi:type III secretion protein V